MPRFPFDTWLMAQEDRVEFFTRGFRERPTEVGLGKILLIVGVAVAFVVVLWLLSRWMDSRREQRPSNNRFGLFLSLCKAHGLRWQEWWLLWCVARQHQLRDPARVFLEPERFHPAHLGNNFESRKERLDALVKKLFAGLPKEEGALK